MSLKAGSRGDKRSRCDEACCADGDSADLARGLGAPERCGCLNGGRRVPAACPTGSDRLLDGSEVRQ